MRTPQEPINSGFSAASTCDDVIADINLKGKTAMVTGGYSGIGLENAKALKKAGARVIVPARDLKRAGEAMKGVEGIELEEMDLLDPKSIEKFATKFLAQNAPLHILINSAGIMAPPLTRDARGFESQFATNHLGHFQLTTLLKPALVKAKGARVVSVSSLGHRFAPMNFDDPNFEHRAYESFAGYGQSKTANILFAVELDRRGQNEGVRAFSVHPGTILNTGLQKFMTQDALKNAGVMDENGNAILDPSRNMKTPTQGGATQLWCATSMKLEGKGGVHCENCDVAVMATMVDKPLTLGDRTIKGGVLPYAIDPESAAKLWTLSETLVFGGKHVW